MKVNVMGATGQLGRCIIQALVDQGAMPENIIASVRTPTKANDFAEMGIEVRRADYDDEALMQNAFCDTDVLALIPSVAMVEPRIAQHHKALSAARAAGVGRVVFISLTTAIPESKFHITPYLLYAESKLRQSGLDWTILRNPMYLDPIADWTPELVEMGRLPYPVRQGRVAFASRADLARGIAAACLGDGHTGQIYALTGPAALSMPELAAILSRITGTDIRFDSISEEEYAEICRSGKEDVLDYLIEILTSIYRAVDNDEFATVTDHIEILTGTPPESAEQYLQRVMK